VAEGDSPGYNWGQTQATGILYVRSEICFDDVRDGTAHTYLIGEKRCNMTTYDWGDDAHMYVGHGVDVARYTALNLPPTRDGIEEGASRFGSVHATGCHFVFADASVRTINYHIDPSVHRRLGHRSDGEPAEE
jgi:hypothetical protein